MLSNKLNTILLNPDDYKNSFVANFLTTIGLTLCYEYNKDTPYLYIIDDFAIEDTTTPRIRIKNNVELDISSFFEVDRINDPAVQKLLKFKLAYSESNDLLDEYSTEKSVQYSAKIQDYLNVGFIVDTIVNEGYKGNFDYDNIRDFLNSLLGHCIRLVEISTDKPLFDIVYTVSNNVMLLKVTYDVPAFDGDFVINNNMVKQLIKNSNFLNVDFYEKRNQMIITGAWFSDKTLKKYKSYFIQELKTLDSNHHNLSLVKDGLLKDNETFEGRRFFKKQIDKLTLARKLAFFAKQKIRFEEKLSFKTLTIEELNPIIDKYPHSSVLKDVDTEVREFVFKLLKEEKLYSEIDNFIGKVSDDLLHNNMDAVKKIFGSKDLSDLEEIIMVKGNSLNPAETLNRVKQWIEPKNYGKIIIKETTQKISNNELWETKKSELTSLIDQEIGRLKAQNQTINEDHLVKLIAEQVNASMDDIRLVVKDIIHEAIAGNHFENHNDINLELLKKKQAELDKAISDLSTFKNLATKSIAAYKIEKTKNQELTDKMMVYEPQIAIQTELLKEEVNQLNSKIELNEFKLKNSTDNNERLEALLKAKEIENQSLKAALQSIRNVNVKKESSSGKKEEALNPQDFAQMEQNLIKLKVEKRLADENQIKSSLELKKIEGRLTMLSTQLEDLQKRKSVLDLELSEKKKEALKLKNENNGLNLRFKELERKLAILERKNPAA